jgi:lysophospholipid acyltransferase (LPLAT)-like uncharacterized protein
MTGRELRFAGAGIAGAGLLALLGRSYRFKIEGREHYESFRRVGDPVIFAFWHRWILPLTFLHRDEGVVVLVSEHGDGEYVTRIIHRMGFGTSRGSSTRGGVKGTRGLVRALRGGTDVAITPDGPRGPATSFKPGALVASQLSGSPIIPIRLSADRSWRLRSWDGFTIPKPFARISVRYGEPRRIPREAGEAELARIAGEIEAFLGREGD